MPTAQVPNFNPRSREGSDHDKILEKESKVNFNPRSREGSDAFSIDMGGYIKIFQSTLPRGERRVYDSRYEKAGRFQSTLPRGERLVRCINKSITISFQSTLPRGERHIWWIYTIYKYNFNPRSREGSDAPQCIHCLM